MTPRALLPVTEPFCCPHCHVAIVPDGWRAERAPSTPGEAIDVAGEPGRQTIELAVLARIARAGGDRVLLEGLCLRLAELVTEHVKALHFEQVTRRALDAMAADTARYCSQCLADQEKAAQRPVFAAALNRARAGLPPVLWGHDRTRVEEAVDAGD